MKALAAAAERFLFDPADPSSVAVFRIALAAMLAWVFSPAGWEPESARHLPGPDALYRDVFLSPAWWWAVLAFLTLFGAGVRPRLAGFALAVLLAPLVFRPGRFPGRLVMEFTLVAFAFLRSDAAFSLRRRGDRLLPRPAAGPLWPIRLLQLQLSVLYGVNALAKSTPEFLSGNVLMAQSYALRNFRADMTDGALSLGPIEMPVWMAGTAAALTEYTLAIGFWFPPLRIPVALVGVGFHLVLTEIVQIGFLNWASIFLYASFLLPFARSAHDEGRT